MTEHTPIGLHDLVGTPISAVAETAAMPFSAIRRAAGALAGAHLQGEN